MTAAPAPAVRRPIKSIDLVYRKRDYRIREDIREAGAAVRPAGEHRGCLLCPRTVRGETNCVTLPDGSRPLCLRCAISAGLLLETPESIERREQEARDIAAEAPHHAPTTTREEG